MYDDLAEIFVLIVAVGYIVLFGVIAAYFVRNGLRSRHRKRPGLPAAPAPPETHS